MLPLPPLLGENEVTNLERASDGCVAVAGAGQVASFALLLAIARIEQHANERREAQRRFWLAPAEGAI